MFFSLYNHIFLCLALPKTGRILGLSTYVRLYGKSMMLTVYGNWRVYNWECEFSGECARNRSTCKHWRHIQSLKTQFIPMDLTGSVRKSLNGSQFVMIMTDRYSGSRRALLKTKIPASHNATFFLDTLMIPYGISMHVSADNETKSIIRMLTAVQSIGNEISDNYCLSLEKWGSEMF